MNSTARANASRPEVLVLSQTVDIDHEPDLCAPAHGPRPELIAPTSTSHEAYRGHLCRIHRHIKAGATPGCPHPVFDGMPAAWRVS